MSRRCTFVPFLFVVCTAVLADSASASDLWVDVTPAPAGTPLLVDVQDVAGGVAIDVSLAGFYVEDRSMAGSGYSMLEIPGCGGKGVVGEPRMPFKTVLIPVPNGPAATLSILTSASSVAMSGATVMPQQAPEPDCGGSSSDFSLDAKVYGADRWFPSEAARIAGDVVVRGQRFLLVEVSPLAFNPARKEILARTDLRLTVNLAGAVDGGAERRKAARRSDLFPTFATLEGLPEPKAIPVGIEYLIIADDPLLGAIGPLADWKRRKGLTVEIVPMSTIGTTSSQLKAFLQDRYDTDPDLTYVLFAGDHPAVPSEDVGGMVTDLYYSCLDGTDYFPDIVTGRIAVQTVTDCENVVDKILTFERDTVPGAWHGDYLMAAYLQGGCQAERFFFETGTHAMHFIRDQVGMGIHTAATSDSLGCNPYYWREDATWYPHRFPGYSGQAVPQADADLITGASQSTQDISVAINGGVSLVQHRDHGGQTGWGDPPFYNSNVSALANGAMTPVVYSINCLTGTFNMSGDCFAEAFLKKYPGGAVGVMAATDVSYSGHNDLLVHGSYDSFWDGYDTDDGGNIYPHSFRPAEAYLYGKYYMYHWQGDGSITQLEFELFHWHGDPEMRVFTAVPVVPNVVVEPTIPVGSPSLAVTVDAEGAMVAVTRDGALLGRAEVAGGVAVVAFEPAPDSPATLDVVVTGHNLVPWQGTVEVIVPEGPWLAHRFHLCDDSNGNGDGIVNPGETIIVPVSVENIGAESGTGLTGVLSSGSAACVVSDPAADFPDVAAGAIVQTLPDHFAITMGGSTPNGHVETLTLNWSASGGYSGSTLFSMPVCEPLSISDVSVDFVGNASAVLTWTTNVPASSRVVYGETVPPALVVEDGDLKTSHMIELTDLDACTDHHVEVVSSSPDCYTTVDDNGGGYYGFTTTAGTVILVDSTDPPLAIPDNTSTGVSSTVVALSPYDVIDINVLINITHTYAGDLDLFLIGPDGSSVELSSDNGGSGDNFTDTLFDDEAATSVTAGIAPFTGSFRPEQPLSAFNGQPASGAWIFKAVDDAGADTGTIDGWQLQLTVNEPCDAIGLIFRDGFEGGTRLSGRAPRPDSQVSRKSPPVVSPAGLFLRDYWRAAEPAASSFAAADPASAPVPAAVPVPAPAAARIPDAVPALARARTSHQLFGCAQRCTAPRRGFLSLEVLNVPQSTPPRPELRKHTWPQHLVALAAKPGEKYGLELAFGLVVLLRVLAAGALAGRFGAFVDIAADRTLPADGLVAFEDGAL